MCVRTHASPICLTITYASFMFVAVVTRISSNSSIKLWCESVCWACTIYIGCFIDWSVSLFWTSHQILMEWSQGATTPSQSLSIYSRVSSFFSCLWLRFFSRSVIRNWPPKQLKRLHIEPKYPVISITFVVILFYFHPV